MNSESVAALLVVAFVLGAMIYVRATQLDKQSKAYEDVK